MPWNHGGSGEVEVLFRPEHVTLTAPGEAALRGRVASAFFLGDRTRVIIEGVGASPLVVETSGEREFAAAEEVGLEIAPDSLLTLRD